MYSISFGKKIPVVTCKVKDLSSKKFVPVKMYEYDCREQSDIDEVKNLPVPFSYKTAIATEMETKKIAREKYSIDTGISHYIIESEQGIPLGIASVKNNEESYGVKFIQTSQNLTHKYVGQAMLASIAQIALNDNRKNFEIYFPTDDAMGFYTHKCGFKHCDSYRNLEMFEKDMKKFIFRTQLKTRAPIGDLRG